MREGRKNNEKHKEASSEKKLSGDMVVKPRSIRRNAGPSELPL